MNQYYNNQSTGTSQGNRQFYQTANDPIPYSQQAGPSSRPQLQPPRPNQAQTQAQSQAQSQSTGNQNQYRLQAPINNFTYNSTGPTATTNQSQLQSQSQQGYSYPSSPNSPNVNSNSNSNSNSKTHLNSTHNPIPYIQNQNQNQNQNRNQGSGIQEDELEEDGDDLDIITNTGDNNGVETGPMVEPHQDLNDFLESFWTRQMGNVERDNPDFKTYPLPLARIKKVMKSDEEVKMISAEGMRPVTFLPPEVAMIRKADIPVPIMFSKACEVFISELTCRAWLIAESNKRRTLQKSDVAAAIAFSDMFDFLIDIVPRDDGNGGNGNGSGSGTGDKGSRNGEIEDEEEEDGRNNGYNYDDRGGIGYIGDDMRGGNRGYDQSQVQEVHDSDGDESVFREFVVDEEISRES